MLNPLHAGLMRMNQEDPQVHISEATVQAGQGAGLAVSGQQGRPLTAWPCHVEVGLDEKLS